MVAGSSPAGRATLSKVNNLFGEGCGRRSQPVLVTGHGGSEPADLVGEKLIDAKQRLTAPGANS